MRGLFAILGLPKEGVMLKSSLRRSFLILVLILMVPSLASAARPAWGLGEWGRTAWDLVFGSKLGCEIGPDGTRCTPTPKHGCEIDPDGKPRCMPTPKHGCEIGPDGKPRCTP